MGPLSGEVGQESTRAGLRILATVLAILTGFLIAIITMLGDPRSLLAGSWRVASAHRAEVRHALDRFAVLFYVYLVTIATVFAASLLEGQIPVVRV